MLRALISWIFGIPNQYPGAASVITGLYAVVGVIAGISAMTTPNTYNPSSTSGAITAGIAIILLSLALLGLTVYAAVDTQFFQKWTRGANGNPAHGFVRWTGPVLLGISIIASVFIVILMLEVLKAAISNS